MRFSAVVAQADWYQLEGDSNVRKDLGVMPAVCPMPVLMVAAYDENGVVNVMNAAWGMTCAPDKIALFINADHKTTKNIAAVQAFTVSIADVAAMDEADFFGIATGNKMPDKFAVTGFHAEKSAHVNAPVIEEFPLCMECELAEIIQTDNVHAVIGKLVNVNADEKVLDANGKVAPEKLNALIFDQFQSGYYAFGEKKGQAWNAGKELMRKAKAQD